MTVVLSAVIGTFVLELGADGLSNSGAGSIGLSTSVSDGTFTATIVTGSAENVSLLVNGSIVDSISNAQAGDSLSANISPGSEVVVTSTESGSTTVIVREVVSRESSVSGISGPSEGLIAYYEFDSGSGTTAIDSSNDYDGTLFNGTTWSSNSKVGPYAGKFDGSDDAVNISGIDPSDSGFTISMWVNPAGLPPDKNQQLVFLGGPNADQQLEFRFDRGATDWMFYNTSGSHGIDGYSKQVKNNTWTMVTGTYNDSTGEWTLYFNSTVETTNTVSVNLGTIGDLGHRIGRHNGGFGESFGGRIDDVRLYSRELNTSEVSTLYNSTK